MTERCAPPPAGHLASAAESDLMLRELSHRVGSDAAAVVATLQIALAAGQTAASRRLLAEAIARASGTARQHAMLVERMPAPVDVGARIGDICRSIVGARLGIAGGSVRLDLAPALLPPVAARRLLLIAYDLVQDSLDQAFSERGGRMAVRLRASRSVVRLRVTDDRPAGRPFSDKPGHASFCAELVDFAGGRITVTSSLRGNIANVLLPTNRTAAADPRPDRSTGGMDRERLASLMARWELDGREATDLLQLEDAPVGWSGGRRSQPESAERLVLASALADALEFLIDGARIGDWLRTPTPAFGWTTPLQAAGDLPNLRALLCAADALALTKSVDASNTEF